MISDQIIEEYLEQENEYAARVSKLKISLLLISIVALLVFSL